MRGGQFMLAGKSNSQRSIVEEKNKQKFYIYIYIFLPFNKSQFIVI